MKRCLALLLAIVTILLPCGITVNAEGELSENSKNMITFIKEKNNNLLVSRNNYAYMKLGAKWYSDVGVNYCLQMADLLIDTGSCPDKEKYMEVLINIIATYDMDNAADLSSQKKQDNLKSIKDYAMDIAKMAGDAVSVHSKLKGIKGELSNIEEVLSKAIDGVGVLADNTNNWLEALTNLETFTQDFSNYNSFLKCIEENSDGELKDAAYTLRNSLKKSFLLKLEAYSKVSSDNFNNYTFFFFDDVFFDAAKAVSEYETDDAYKFIINSSEGAWERFFILKGSWDLGKDIGKLVGNIVVGGENLINRTLEIEALYDISVILQTKVLDATTEFLSHSPDDDADAYIDEYVTFANFLIGCRIRGEYCTYSILAEDSGLLSLLSDKTDAKNWYDAQTSAIIGLKNRINHIKTANTTNEYTAEELIDKSLEDIAEIMGDDFKCDREYVGSPAFGSDNVLWIYSKNVLPGFAIHPELQFIKDYDNGLDVKKKIKNGQYSYTGISLIGDAKYNEKISANMKYNELTAQIGEFDVRGAGIETLTYSTTINNNTVYFVFELGDELKTYYKDGIVSKDAMKQVNPKLHSIAVYKNNTYRDDFIESLLNNEEKWAKNYGFSSSSEIYFEDLDMDGKLELIRCDPMQGSGHFTYNDIFVYKNDELTKAGYIHGFFSLYKNNDSDYIIISSENTKSGVTYYCDSNYKYQFSYVDDVMLLGGTFASHITEYTLTGERQEKYHSYTSDKPNEGEEITESEYNLILEKSKLGYQIVYFDSDKYYITDWSELSQDKKRQVLTDLYDSYKLK